MNSDILSECVRLNQALPKNGLVKLTWGNASILSDCGTEMAIKPSGIPFDSLTEDMVSVVQLSDGTCLAGKKPSVDFPIHLEIYREFPQVKSVIHTHSRYATSWAQAAKPIPILGTTHADYFDGDIPLCDVLTDIDLFEYENSLGETIVRYFIERGLNPLNTPAILIPFHGCVTFGDSPKKALEAAIVLEEVAEMALHTHALGQHTTPLAARPLFQKHFERKNGKGKYYGQ